MIRKGLLSAACVVVLAGVGCQSNKSQMAHPMQTTAMSGKPATSSPAMTAGTTPSSMGGSPYASQNTYKPSTAGQPGTIGMPSSSSMGGSGTMQTGGSSMPTLPGSLPSTIGSRTSGSDMGGSYQR